MHKTLDLGLLGTARIFPEGTDPSQTAVSLTVLAPNTVTPAVTFQL